MKRCESIRKTGFLQILKISNGHFITDFRNIFFHQKHGIIDENSGEFTVFHFYFAAIYFRIHCNSGYIKCFLVSNRCMSVHSFQIYRTIREQFIEFCFVRKLFYRPIILIPTSAIKPFQRSIFGICCKSRKNFVPGFCAPQFAFPLISRVTSEMAVRIDKSRKN